MGDGKIKKNSHCSFIATCNKVLFQGGLLDFFFFESDNNEDNVTAHVSDKIEHPFIPPTHMV